MDHKEILAGLLADLSYFVGSWIDFDLQRHLGHVFHLGGAIAEATLTAQTGVAIDVSEDISFSY